MVTLIKEFDPNGDGKVTDPEIGVIMDKYTHNTVFNLESLADLILHMGIRPTAGLVKHYDRKYKISDKGDMELDKFKAMMSEVNPKIGNMIKQGQFK